MMIASSTAYTANMGSQDAPPLLPSSRAAIRDAARRHGVGAVRWWPPHEGDLLVTGVPLTLRELRADLERALGCRVAIYLADCLAEETRHRLERESIDLLSDCA